MLKPFGFYNPNYNTRETHKVGKEAANEKKISALPLHFLLVPNMISFYTPVWVKSRCVT